MLNRVDGTCPFARENGRQFVILQSRADLVVANELRLKFPQIYSSE